MPQEGPKACSDIPVKKEETIGLWEVDEEDFRDAEEGDWNEEGFFDAVPYFAAFPTEEKKEILKDLNGVKYHVDEIVEDCGWMASVCVL